MPRRCLDFPLWIILLPLGRAFSVHLSYLGSSFSLESSSHENTTQVLLYYRGIASTCSSTEDEICKAVNCTSRLPAAELENNSTAPCQREGEANLSLTSSKTFHLRLSSCCWSQEVLSPHKDNTTSIPFKVAMTYALGTRSDTGLGNCSPQMPLLPALRVPQNCPTTYNLSAWDRDGDTVRCHYILGEEFGCAFCKKHPFLLLDEEACTLTYDGMGLEGTYPLELMAEDFPRQTVTLTAGAWMQEIHPYNTSNAERNQALSSVPLQFTLTVQKPVEDCSFGIRRPTFLSPTPDNGERISLLPYEEVSFTVVSANTGERISDMQVLGPSGLHTWVLTEESISTASVNITWENSNSRRPCQASICFVATTLSGLQSELRCIWIMQAADYPQGNVLLCLQDRMQLSVPRLSIGNLQEGDLQRSNPECLVNSNSTHVQVEIPLERCGTRRKENASFFIFTNKITGHYSGASPSAFRKSLAIPVTCRYRQEEDSNNYCPSVGEDDKGFGNFSFDIRFIKPTTEGMTWLKQVASLNASVNDQLLISVSAKSDLASAHLVVQSCQVGGNKDAVNASIFIIQKGCLNLKAAEEVILEGSKDKLYGFWLSSVASTIPEVFVTCDVRLCCSPSRFNLCPGCQSSRSHRTSKQILQTKLYRISTGPIRITKNPTSGTNYTALVVGVVLGCTVICVVFLLVKKSFVGVQYRNVSLQL
ncbi:uncharacterized protein [Struthio camelus]|uniref:uncharacterized protein n=1 Tax=Struthio camelus TaxID=8801 RepID=UPI003603FCDF